MVLLSVLHLAASVWLSVYGFNAFLLVWLYWKYRRPLRTPLTSDRIPIVTVQIPVYNERHVVLRAIQAAAQLDWPHDRLQIQVLDDSTDETVDLARSCVASYREEGLDIVHRCRAERSGFKAGALNAAMGEVRGEFVAIFDADFVPEPSFLQRTIPHLLADPELAFVQARWGHLNDTFSRLTLGQAIALDGHFAVEHPARERAGLLTTFNGTGGVWRTRAIVESGGWDPEQLTEDVDLSYRAQLLGWRGLTLPHVAVSAEIPAQLAALKRQQFRWAKGNIQCLLKLNGRLFRAPLSWLARLQALLHLGHYLGHPLILVVMLCTLPLAWLGLLDRWSLTFLSVATLGPPLLYAVGQRVLYPDWRRRLRGMPALVCTGLGLALNSTVAVIESLLGIKSAFQRTPKFRIDGPTGDWRASPYALPTGIQAWGEMALALYALLSIIVAFLRGYLLAIPFLLLYVLGFGYVALLGIAQSRRPPQTGNLRPAASALQGTRRADRPDREPRAIS